MILGIVGSEAAKFTQETEALARKAIRGAIKTLQATKVCSGECPIGGVDIYAKEEAIELLGKDGYIGHPPKVHQWGGKDGYMARNKQIAETSHVVICFTVRTLPPDYIPKGWEWYCYHCGTDQHIKSGGCWTTKYARSLGKSGYTLIVE
jgi:hypothetical protein